MWTLLHPGIADADPKVLCVLQDLMILTLKTVILQTLLLHRSHLVASILPVMAGILWNLLEVIADLRDYLLDVLLFVVNLYTIAMDFALKKTTVSGVIFYDLNMSTFPIRDMKILQKLYSFNVHLAQSHIMFPCPQNHPREL